MEACLMSFPKDRTEEGSEHLMEISRIIGPMVNNAVDEIIKSHKMELFTQPMDYIVPAIWGAKKDGKLDVTQKNIHNEITPTIKSLCDSLQLKDISDAQEFAIGYLVRSLLIYKIAYMVDGAKNMAIHKMCLQDQDTNILNHIEFFGTA